MQLLPFGDYRPDISDILGNHTRVLTNVVPRADGYGPVRAVEAYSDALPAACRGSFRALNSAGVAVIFAGTASKLYRLDNTTLEWINVSKTAGAHTYTLPSDQIWQWAQYDDYVYAVQGGDAPQVFELGVSTYFADLGGSPPQAKYIAIVNEFVVLSGLVSFPYRVQWSGRSSPTTWTSGTLESDFQDFGDGGPIGPLGGGEGSTLLLQSFAMRRMVYQPGSPVIFSFERISEDIGIQAPYTVVKAGRRVFFFSNSGFQMSIDGNVPTPIGKEIVDNTFLGEWDDNYPNLTFGVPDPRGTRIMFAYKTLSSSNDTMFDKVLVYDWLLEKWSSIISISGQFTTALSQSALTLESLDSLAFVDFTGDTTNASAIITNVSSTTGLYVGMVIAGTGIPAGAVISSIDSGTQITLDQNATATDTTVALSASGSLDSITVSSLDAFPVAFGKEIAVFTSANKLGFMTGSNLEAVLETPEQGEAGKQMLVSGLHPVCDADVAYGRVSRRQHVGATRVYETEYARDGAGFVPARIDTRYSRYRLRIPAGSTWTFAAGVVPVETRTGMR